MLPSDFLSRMKDMLGEEYNSFLDSFNDDAVRSIRVNTNKISVQDFIKICPFEIEKIPYTDDGFYVYNGEHLGNDPYHHAGLFYVQDPAAMMPINTVNIESDFVCLDLCASPGGKTTQIASKLKDGILVSNEVNYNRAKVLFSNVERLGFDNVIVLNEDSKRLSNKYKNTFDFILIDAPCSGEGMFRKNSEAIDTFSDEKVKECASIQRSLINDADVMLKDGGYLLYSTCTYEEIEDELVVDEFLNNHDYEVVKCSDLIKKYTKDGYIKNCKHKELIEARRFYPHISKGEGQFSVLLKKKGSLTKNKKCIEYSKLIDKYINNDVNINVNACKYMDKFYNKINFNVDGLKIVSGGVQLGELVNNRFVYHHNFVTAYGKYFNNKLDLKYDDERVRKYLHGEEIYDDNVKDGFGVVMVDGYPLGLFKASHGAVKNHYPKGLRTL